MFYMSPQNSADPNGRSDGLCSLKYGSLHIGRNRIQGIWRPGSGGHNQALRWKQNLAAQDHVSLKHESAHVTSGWFSLVF